MSQPWFRLHCSVRLEETRRAPNLVSRSQRQFFMSHDIATQQVRSIFAAHLRSVSEQVLTYKAQSQSPIPTGVPSQLAGAAVLDHGPKLCEKMRALPPCSGNPAPPVHTLAPLPSKNELIMAANARDMPASARLILTPRSAMRVSKASSWLRAFAPKSTKQKYAACSFLSLPGDRGLPGGASSECAIIFHGRSGVEGTASSPRLTNSLNSGLAVRMLQGRANGRVICQRSHLQRREG